MDTQLDIEYIVSIINQLRINYWIIVCPFGSFAVPIYLSFGASDLRGLVKEQKNNMICLD